jgi:hypothetical protein
MTQPPTDWRGDISIPKATAKERIVQTQSIAQRLAHAKRRAAGTNMAKAGGKWARSIRSDIIRSRTDPTPW